MRLAWLVMIALVSTAHADKKLQAWKADFVRELAGCQVQTRGLAKVLAGATELARTAEPVDRTEREHDVEQLTHGLAIEKEYCDEVAAVIAFLEANPAALYRSIERELDARYTRIVKLRAAAKQMLEQLGPTTRKLIPLLARRPPPPAEPKRLPGKFPSGRVVELPALAGTWRIAGTTTTDTADYSEAAPHKPAIIASATTRTFAGTTCAQQHEAVLARTDAEQLVDVDLPAAKALRVAWGARYIRREPTAAHLVTVLCVPSSQGAEGGLLATADVVPADRRALVDELTSLMLRMITARAP
jgi:hypothetical protein